MTSHVCRVVCIEVRENVGVGVQKLGYVWRSQRTALGVGLHPLPCLGLILLFATVFARLPGKILSFRDSLCLPPILL